MLWSADVQLIPFQTCQTTEGWWPVRVTSSAGEQVYTVWVSPWAPEESICECKSYIYRFHCKHQDEAARRVCRWSELRSPQQQNPDERTRKVCPACGGSTRWEVEVVDED